MRYFTLRPELLVDGLAQEDLRVMEHGRLYGIMLDGIGVLLALFLPAVAIAIYTVVALYFIIQPLIFGRTLKRSLKKQGE
jgi:hypothetical protein